MNYWNHVLWSNESKVNLFDSDGVQHVWRCPGEEYQEYCVFPTVKHGGGSIMVLGCMSTAGTGELRFIEGNMDSNMYCDILKQNMIRFKVQGSLLFVTYTIIQGIIGSEMLVRTGPLNGKCKKEK